MQVTMSVAIMQILRLYCNYAGGTFCYSYVGGSFCCNHACDCFCCSYSVRSFCSTYASDSFIIEYVGDNIYCIYADGSPVAIMQVVLSAVHNRFYCKMQVTVPVITM